MEFLNIFTNKKINKCDMLNQPVVQSQLLVFIHMK